MKIKGYLTHCIEKGAKVSIGGIYLSPEKEMSKILAVSEDSRYMPDFMEDRKGEVFEVRFDKVVYR
ncbi:MAG: hypothetical protein K5931_11505 [Lachnospiraceae bacterium]|nr:hypothetical protein [Lachnospiraceae bacterium]